MAYVPNLPSQNPQNALGTQAPATAQPMPSKTNLMMAMAEMHKQGKFAPAARETTASRTLRTNPTLRKLSPLKTQR